MAFRHNSIFYHISLYHATFPILANAQKKGGIMTEKAALCFLLEQEKNRDSLALKTGRLL